MAPGVRVLLAPLLALVVAGCASIPDGRIGIDRLRLHGVDQMNDSALAQCLLTVERSRPRLTLGVSAARCNVPPFDSAPPQLSLMAMPWADYPLLNLSVLDVDQKRIERWYRARGFYDARVRAITFEPGDLIGGPHAAADCPAQASECSVTVSIAIEEGQPIRVGQVRLEGDQGTVASVARELRQIERPKRGQRFDELDHDRFKDALVELARNRGYADARVRAQVRIDHADHRADIRYRLLPGPRYRFGRVHVQGQERLDVQPIMAAAGLGAGRLYSNQTLAEAQHAVYDLGAFSTVEIQTVLDRRAHRAHVTIVVAPLKDDQLRLSVGVMSGALQRTDAGQLQSISQWDVHLSARYEIRHVWGTLGRLRLEDQPRLIFAEQFPRTDAPRLGNLLRIKINQPGLLEPRTDWLTSGSWDYGPDPFLKLIRSEIAVRTGVQRSFIDNALGARFAVQHDRYFLHQSPTEQLKGAVVERYRYSYLEQSVNLDLRDQPAQPTEGAYFAALAHEAVVLPGMSDWSMVQLQGEVRTYLPLPWSLVAAARFALAANLVLASTVVDPTKSLKPSDPNPPPPSELGPSTYRLRGGGAQSNRGYVAGELGSGRNGGVRRWEAAFELRARLGQHFGAVLFCDLGDVHDRPSFRWDQPRPSVGLGLRYLTVVGSLRFDVGFRLADRAGPTLPLIDRPGAFHLTLGEAF